MSVKVRVNSLFPAKTAILSLPKDSSMADIKKRAEDALGGLDLTEYTWALVSFQEDVSPLHGKADTEKLDLKDGTILFASAPASMMPVRKADKKDGAEVEEDHEVKFKALGFDDDTIFKLLTTLKIEKKKLAWEYIDLHAARLAESKEFLNAPKDLIIAFVKRERLGIGEFELFNAVLAWAKFYLKKTKEAETPKSTRNLLKGIFEHIRFPLMSNEDIAAKIAPLELLEEQELLDLFTYISQRDTPGIKPTGAIAKFKATPRSGSASSARCEPPSESDPYAKEERGVFYCLGTGGGKKPHANPHTTGLVLLTCEGGSSNWTSGFSETSLVDTLSSGRTFVKDVCLNGQWIMVDLKENRLDCTHYLMKNGGGRGLVIRDWVLEAKVKESDASWVAIKTHKDDGIYAGDGSNGFGAHVFAVDTRDIAKPVFYRYFRLRRTDTKKNFYIHRWELYGNLKQGVKA